MGTQRSVSADNCSEGLMCLRCSDLIVTKKKTRAFFEEMSPQTVVTWENYFFCFVLEGKV